MPAADTARLIASLEMDTRKFNAGAQKAMGSINRIDRRLGAFSGAINRNLGRIVDAGITSGVRLLTGAVKGGIDSLVQLEDATTQVDGALKATGMQAQVTSAQISQWANEIETATQAAFDDKDITRNAATLIRYGRVTTSNLRPALQVMTDLAAKTGSVDSASRLLARALADPAKAVGALRKASVFLNEQQQKRLKQLTSLTKEEQKQYAQLRKTDRAAAERYKANKLALKQGEAQKFLIEQIGVVTKDAAVNAYGPLADAQHEVTDAVEETQKAFAVAFLPAILKVSGKLKEVLARQDVQDAVRRLGENLAGVIDKAIAFAEKIDWDKVGAALGVAAGFAGDLLNAFTQLDPKVQGSIVGILALNKVSGGIVGDVGKGILTALLGAGVAGGIKALFGGKGGGGKGGGGGGTAGTGTASAGVFIPDMHAFNADLADRLQASGTKFGQQAGAAFREEASKKTIWDDILISLGVIENRWAGTGNAESTKHRFGESITDPGTVAGALNDFRKGEREAWTDTTTAVRDVKAEQARAAESMGHAIGSNESTTRSGLSNVAAATNNSASRISGAIAANRPIVTTNVDVNITSTGVAKAQVSSNRYGPSEPAYSGPSGKYDKP